MRIGLIGFGFMGGVHLSAIEQIEGVSLTALSTRTRPTPEKAAVGNLPQFKPGTLPEDLNWYPDWQQLLLDPNVDAVDVCVPTHLHKQIVLSAFEKGKHVLCEKPMALTPSDCDQMLEAASKSGRTFMVGQILRFNASYHYAASFIDETCHGSIKSCVMSRKTGYPQWSEWLSKTENSGGAILDLLCHDIDEALNLFGLPDKISAVSDGEIDTMRGVLHYANGLNVQINGGWYAPELPFSAGFEITGEDASLILEAGELRQVISGKEEHVDVPKDREYIEELTYFVECCRNNRTPELCPPVESAQAVKIAALLRSSRDQNGKELPCEK